LKPGNCIAFGNAFKVPVSMYIDLPNPRPMSNNVDIQTVWYDESRLVARRVSNPVVNNNVPVMSPLGGMNNNTYNNLSMGSRSVMGNPNLM